MTTLTRHQQNLKDHSYAYRSDIRHAFDAGNDNGEGFALGADTDTPHQAAEREGYEILSDYDGFVVGARDEETVIIADVNGPWAVSISDWIDGE